MCISDVESCEFEFRPHPSSVYCVLAFQYKLAEATTYNRVHTALENPGKPWNLKIKIQALENP